MTNIDKWLAQIIQFQPLSEENMAELCSLVLDILIEEDNVIQLSSPIHICGDIHGQFVELLQIFKRLGEVGDKTYLFLGDYVDRGYYSLETLQFLLCLKAKFPTRIWLIRGNHECRQITQVYGYYDEVINYYGNSRVWKESCNLFDFLPLAALVDSSIFCVHGGLSVGFSRISEINAIFRGIDIPSEGIMCDMVWSDPEDCLGFSVMAHGSGTLFGEDVVKDFHFINGTKLLCRSHQLVSEGYQYKFGTSLVTIFSAPNYCYRCGNVGGVMTSIEGKEIFTIFEMEEKEKSSKKPKSFPLMS